MKLNHFPLGVRLGGGFAVVLSLYSFWNALLGNKATFMGYTRAEMMTYVLAINVLRDTAGDPGKQHPAHAKPLDQRSRGGRCRDLADTRQRQHHRLSEQQPAMELAPRMPHAGAPLKLFEQTGLLLHQSTQDGKRRFHCLDKRYLSRNSRRKIFPTGVLGKSPRNSISFGCL